MRSGVSKDEYFAEKSLQKDSGGGCFGVLGTILSVFVLYVILDNYMFLDGCFRSVGKGTQNYSSSKSGSSRDVQPLSKKAATSFESVVFSKPILNKFSGKCIKVVNGDTIDLLTARNVTTRVRFESIDTPERGQPFGNNATEFVKARCIGKEVTVLVTGRDKYKRDLGYVVSGGNVNADLVSAGLAWVYRDYTDDPQLISLEEDARNSKLGLWKDNRRVSPWDWRELSKEEREKLR